MLARHGLPRAAPLAGAGGTFPAFLVGRYVVKFFSELFAGAICHQVEQSLHREFLAHPEIPAPRLVAEGRLFSDGWTWPYLVTTRLTGASWHDLAPEPSEQARLAGELGIVLRRVHQLPPPAGQVWERDLLADLRATCVDRHRQWGMLPGHLVDQIDRYLLEPSPLRRLLHADLHWDHIFVDRGRLVGIVDWGDALLADPFYELPALHLETFGGNKRLLRTFLAGYGWEMKPDFAKRAMTMTLLHEFNPLGALRATPDLQSIPTLDQLAQLLWELPSRSRSRPA